MLKVTRLIFIIGIKADILQTYCNSSLSHARGNYFAMTTWNCCKKSSMTEKSTVQHWMRLLERHRWIRVLSVHAFVKQVTVSICPSVDLFFCATCACGSLGRLPVSAEWRALVTARHHFTKTFCSVIPSKCVLMKFKMVCILKIFRRQLPTCWIRFYQRQRVELGNLWGMCPHYRRSFFPVVRLC